MRKPAKTRPPKWIKSEGVALIVIVIKSRGWTSIFRRTFRNKKETRVRVGPCPTSPRRLSLRPSILRMLSISPTRAVQGAGLVMVLVNIVTCSICDKARPSNTAPVFIVIWLRAMMVPLKSCGVAVFVGEGIGIAVDTASFEGPSGVVFFEQPIITVIGTIGIKTKNAQ